MKVYLSIRLALIVVVIEDGTDSLSLKTDSITVSSVEVVSMPVKAHQSLTTMPAETTSLPLFTVPACKTELSLHFLKNLVTYNQRHLKQR